MIWGEISDNNGLIHHSAVGVGWLVSVCGGGWCDNLFVGDVVFYVGEEGQLFGKLYFEAIFS